MAAPDFFVEDLLDLSNGDDVVPDIFLFDNSPSIDISISTDSSITAANSSISPVGADSNFSPPLPNRSFPDVQLSGGLPVPYDDLGELEWLSNFEEELFPPSDDVDLHLITGPKPDPVTIPQPEIPVPVTPGGPDNVPSRKHALSPKSDPKVVREVRQRRCSHCSADKTPQWRTGPMGPKTLCNACGVRYNSGRLVPEYRPAASPTFIPNRHSNSHKRVLELRKQKAGQRSILRHQQLRRPIPAAPAAGGFFGGDVNRRVSPT